MEKEVLSDLEVLAGKIQLIAKKIKTDSNPEELDALKKIIKKNVPFTLRGYFAAYLLRESNLVNHTTRKPVKEFKKANADKAINSDKPASEKKTFVPKEMPEGSKTLYLNIGKFKKLYAKDLSILLQTELGITREDIFNIRVHDKFSFITMSEENCNKALEVLQGKTIKGRVAQINYSNR